jgi:phage/plasmid primase-like uncharacterized protein/transposase-like protein
MTTCASDPLADFAAAIAGAGLPAPATLHADGKLHRFSTNGKGGDTSGWYVLHLGGKVPAGAFGDWRTDLSATWCAKPEGELSKAERRERIRRIKAAQAARDQERKQRHQQAAEEAAQIWAAATAADGHPYLQRKGVWPHGVRQDRDGLLLVPMRDASGALCSLQSIDVDGSKMFLPGGRTAGCYFAIDGDRATVYVTEGFATGASIREATGAAVAVAFSAGQLTEVAKAIREKFPDAELVVAADNDVRADGSDNTGVIRATEAASATGARLAVPELDGGKCDFNDVAVAAGLDEVRRQLGCLYSPPRNSATAQPLAEMATSETPKLALSKDILADFRRDVQLRGLVGEIATAQTLYLAITSRLLNKPVSVGVKGHSSSGKSHTVDRVLEFFPDEAVVKFTAMSERALIYREGDYKHRTLVIYEVTGLREGNEDDMTSYFIRSLLSEGRISYDVTVRGQDGQYGTQTIVKEGPTGLVFTTTKTRVHAENETRVLSLNTDDGTEQTRAVLRALANEGENPVDLSSWRQFQAWLQHAEKRVTIPFAATLAELVPPLAVRLRRDFTAVLALVRAHAILHQATRERDERGWIMATLDDYAAVRELVAGVVSEGIGSTVADTVRETVRTVELLGADQGASVNEIAHRLGIDKSNASRRIRRAADSGYIRNREDKRGRPGRWVMGDPLPEEVEVLPQPATVRNAAALEIQGGCAVALAHDGVHTPEKRAASRTGSIPPRNDAQQRNTPDDCMETRL